MINDVMKNKNKDKKGENEIEEKLWTITMT